MRHAFHMIACPCSALLVHILTTFMGQGPQWLAGRDDIRVHANKLMGVSSFFLGGGQPLLVVQKEAKRNLCPPFFGGGGPVPLF